MCTVKNRENTLTQSLSALLWEAAASIDLWAEVIHSWMGPSLLLTFKRTRTLFSFIFYSLLYFVHCSVLFYPKHRPVLLGRWEGFGRKSLSRPYQVI